MGVNVTTEYSYDQMWVDVASDDSFTFSVRTCESANIGLFSVLGDDTSEMYRIEIGGYENTRSIISHGHLRNQLSVELETYNQEPLSCTEMRPFWVSWQGADIQVGSGSVVGAALFMQWQDTFEPIPVRGVSLTAGNVWVNVVGYWRLGTHRELMSNIWTLSQMNKQNNVTYIDLFLYFYY